jgi:CubicO group peptidase (beta-lactamase class C family)
MTLVDRIRTLVETERERFGVPGCAVVVVKDGDVVIAEGFGKRDVDADLPVTSETLFPIGSSTKTFTTAVLATLVDEGKLDFDAPLTSYLPGFALHDPVATQLLSVRDCLSHRSGLPRHDLVWYAGDGILSRDDAIAALPHLPPTQPFRQAWQYNNLLYLTAGHLAGKLVGGTYEDAVRDRVLAPLGMTRTNFSVVATQADADHAKPYVRNVGDTIAKQVPFASLDLAGPAGNINSCVDELVPWLKTLLAQGIDGHEPLLSTSVLQELRTPAWPIVPMFDEGVARNVGYGLALVIEEYRGKRVTHHGGNIDGFSSQVLTVPDEGIGIAVLTNLHATAARDAIPYLILDALDGVEPVDHGATYHARMTALLEAMDNAKKSGAARSKPLPAVRPLTDYVGEYTHPGYGPVTVGEGLTFRYYNLPEGRLEHRHLEVFDVVVQVSGDDARFPAQFTHDLEGEVDGFLVKLEQALPPIRFERRHSDAHLTDSFLDEVAGTYAFGAVKAVVTRRGDKELLVAVAGGPQVALVPRAGRVFTLDGAPVEFAEDGRLVTPMGDFLRV